MKKLNVFINGVLTEYVLLEKELENYPSILAHCVHETANYSA
jgi:hypothetical protein